MLHPLLDGAFPVSIEKPAREARDELVSQAPAASTCARGGCRALCTGWVSSPVHGVGVEPCARGGLREATVRQQAAGKPQSGSRQQASRSRQQASRSRQATVRQQAAGNPQSGSRQQAIRSRQQASRFPAARSGPTSLVELVQLPQFSLFLLMTADCTLTRQ
ncbi:unnamed protein product [Lampetra planeri]